tara:strand:- start:66 stop:176 length:111 start_codon:yes stop_codon:yes gene_type:complete
MVFIGIVVDFEIRIINSDDPNDLEETKQIKSKKEVN